MFSPYEVVLLQCDFNLAVAALAPIKSVIVEATGFFGRCSNAYKLRDFAREPNSAVFFLPLVRLVIFNNAFVQERPYRAAAWLACSS